MMTLSGCSTTVPINYIPSSSVRGHGDIIVGSVRYLPADTGSVKPNQFQKNSSSIGEKFTNQDVALIIKSALQKELAYAGYSSSGADALRIDVDVTRFYVDWLGFSNVDFDVGIAFRVSRSGKVFFQHSSFAHQIAPKTESMSQQPEAIRAAISACIDDFLAQGRLQGLL